MQIKNIALENGAPSFITVEMTAEEAAFLAMVTGRMNDPAATEAFGRSTQAHSETYDCLSGEFFNRFYDDGVKEWMRK